MKKLLITGFLVFWGSVSVQADNDWLTQLQQKITAYWQSYQPEKVYLQNDREIYAASDTIWLKAYVVNTQHNTLRQNPAALQLSLISAQNQAIITQRINVRQGIAQASLVLPDSLKSGQYLLQAFTEDQRAANPASFVRKIIFINTKPGIAKTVSETGKKPVSALTFFPESGTLVPDVENKVGFQALDASGKPTSVTGTITDESGKVVGNFQSDPFGIGSLNLRPAAGKNYVAQVKTISGMQAFPLPAAQAGIALKLEQAGDSVKLTIQGSEVAKNEELGLVIQQNGKVIKTEAVQLNENSRQQKNFSSITWPAGVLQVTLFNKDLQPVAERLFFKAPTIASGLRITVAKSTYGRREPVQVNVQVKDGNGNPVEASLAATVVNSDKKLAPAFPLAGQLSSLSAQAALNPEFYLKNKEALDALLLTQKINQASWNEILNAQPGLPVAARSEGKIQGIAFLDSVKLARATIYLMDTRTGQTEAVVTDADGKFWLPSRNTSRYFYQVWQQGVFKQHAVLQIEQLSPVLPAADWALAFTEDATVNQKMELKQKVQAFYNPKTIAPEVSKRRAEDWPKYPADRYYPLEEYNDMHTVEEIFREMIPSVRIIRRKGQTTANMYNVERRDFYPHAPLYIIDGKPTWNSDLFLRLDGAQVRQVNIYYSSKNLQPFGFMGNQGVIAVFTKNGNYQDPDLNTEFILNVPEQNVAHEFKPRSYPANLPDFRSTLYWNPELLVNRDGNASFTFFTSDETGEILVEVSGITKDGQLISQQVTLPVNAIK